MKVSIRTCVACRHKDERKSFFRVTKSPDGKVFLDKSYKSSGRSAYVCKDLKCMETVMKKKSFNYAFKTTVNPCYYETVLQDMKAVLDNKISL